MIAICKKFSRNGCDKKDCAYAKEYDMDKLFDIDYCTYKQEPYYKEYITSGDWKKIVLSEIVKPIFITGITKKLT